MIIENTGERVIPDYMKPTNGLLLEHIARYHFSNHYTKGRILDLACGSGFGSHMLAKLGKKRINQIVAVDCDPKTVAYAQKRYDHPLVEYRCEDAVNPLLPQKLGLFDVIVSFETIEHIEDEQQFLSNVYQLLKPGGVLVISTPYGKGRGIPCGSPFHVHQLTVEEFRNLFTEYQHTSFYGQKGVLIEPPITDFWYPIGIALCTK